MGEPWSRRNPRNRVAQFFAAILAPQAVEVVDAGSGETLSWRKLYPRIGGGSIEILRVSLPRWLDPGCRVLLRIVAGNRADWVWREATYQAGRVYLNLPERAK